MASRYSPPVTKEYTREVTHTLRDFGIHLTEPQRKYMRSFTTEIALENWAISLILSFLGENTHPRACPPQLYF